MASLRAKRTPWIRVPLRPSPADGTATGGRAGVHAEATGRHGNSMSCSAPVPDRRWKALIFTRPAGELPVHKNCGVAVDRVVRLPMSATLRGRFKLVAQNLGCGCPAMSRTYESCCMPTTGAQPVGAAASGKPSAGRLAVRIGASRDTEPTSRDRPGGTMYPGTARHSLFSCVPRRPIAGSSSPPRPTWTRRPRTVGAARRSVVGPLMTASCADP